MLLTWCISNNIGDMLNIWLCHKVWPGEPVYYARPESYFRKLMICGSILNHADRDTVVCGAGIANATDGIDPSCEIRCVRGPLSLRRAKECGNPANAIIGDPAFLCPTFFDPKVKQVYDIGLIPHQYNQASVFSDCKNPEINKINVFDSVEKFIVQIKKCKVIVSSSLHGIILAHAYGVPAVWFETGEPIGGDGIKFHDYFASVGLNVMPVKWYELNDMTDDEIKRIAVPPKRLIDTEGILDCLKR